MNHENDNYIPALRYRWLTRFYDPVVAFTSREKVFKRKLLAQVTSNHADQLLDLACGTGTLAEVRRILKTGGRFFVCDWGKPANLLLRLSFYLVQILDGFDVTRDNVQGRLPEFITTAGFDQVEVVERFATMLGTLDLIKASNA